MNYNFGGPILSNCLNISSQNVRHQELCILFVKTCTFRLPNKFFQSLKWCKYYGQSNIPWGYSEYKYDTCPVTLWCKVRQCGQFHWLVNKSSDFSFTKNLLILLLVFKLLSRSTNFPKFASVFHWLWKIIPKLLHIIREF